MNFAYCNSVQKVVLCIKHKCSRNVDMREERLLWQEYIIFLQALQCFRRRF